MKSYLNTENIARSKGGVEYHPLRPFLPEHAKVLFLGSFPPQRKRWSMDFFYPNFINDHWRIEGQIFFGDKNHFVDLEAKRFKHLRTFRNYCISCLIVALSLPQARKLRKPSVPRSAFLPYPRSIPPLPSLTHRISMVTPFSFTACHPLHAPIPWLSTKR